MAILISRGTYLSWVAAQLVFSTPTCQILTSLNRSLKGVQSHTYIRSLTRVQLYTQSRWSHHHIIISRLSLGQLLIQEGKRNTHSKHRGDGEETPVALVQLENQLESHILMTYLNNLKIKSANSLWGGEC